MRLDTSSGRINKAQDIYKKIIFICSKSVDKSCVTKNSALFELDGYMETQEVK